MVRTLASPFRLLSTVAVVGFLLAACSSGGDTVSEAPNLDGGSSGAVVGDWAAPVEVGGVTFTASNPTVGDQGTSDASLSFDLSITNDSDTEYDYTEAEIVCDEPELTGVWRADTTFDFYAALTIGTTLTGTVVLDAPGGGIGAPLPVCTNPRVQVRATAMVMIDGKPEPARIEFPLDPAITPHD